MDSKWHNASILVFMLLGMLVWSYNSGCIQRLYAHVFIRGNRTHNYITVPGISKGSIITSLSCSCLHDSSKKLEN